MNPADLIKSGCFAGYTNATATTTLCGLGGAVAFLFVHKGQGHNMWEDFFQGDELVTSVIKHAK